MSGWCIVGTPAGSKSVIVISVEIHDPDILVGIIGYIGTCFVVLVLVTSGGMVCYFAAVRRPTRINTGMIDAGDNFGGESGFITNHIHGPDTEPLAAPEAA